MALVTSAREPDRSNATTAEGLPTVCTALVAHCRVAALCLNCDHVRDLDLKALAGWHADAPVIRLPLGCRCGSRAFRVLVSGVAPSQ